MREISIEMVCIGALTMCAQAQAQSAVTAPNNALTPIEQGVGDVGPLHTSLRIPAGSTQQDVAFEQVYQAPDGTFYRVSGAIYARFERSIYVPTGLGAAPVIPPGTVFYLGAPPDLSGANGPKRSANTLGSVHGQTRMPSLLVHDRIDDRVSTTDAPMRDALRRASPTTFARKLDENDTGTMSHEPTRCKRLSEIARQARQTR